MSRGRSSGSPILDLHRRVDGAAVPGNRDHWPEGGLVRLQKGALTSKLERERALACVDAGGEQRAQPAMVCATGRSSAPVKFHRAGQRELRTGGATCEGHRTAEAVRARSVSSGHLGSARRCSNRQPRGRSARWTTAPASALTVVEAPLPRSHDNRELLKELGLQAEPATSVDAISARASRPGLCCPPRTTRHIRTAPGFMPDQPAQITPEVRGFWPCRENPDWESFPPVRGLGARPTLSRSHSVPTEARRGRPPSES